MASLGKRPVSRAGWLRLRLLVVVPVWLLDLACLVANQRWHSWAAGAAALGLYFVATIVSIWAIAW